MSVKLEVTEMRLIVILYKNNIQRVDQFSVVCCFIDIDICKYEKPGVVRGHNKGIRWLKATEQTEQLLAEELVRSYLSRFWPLCKFKYNFTQSNVFVYPAEGHS